MVDPRAPTRFSATDAAFTGFGLMAREPATVAAWAAVYLASTLVFAAGMVSTVGPTLTTMLAQRQDGIRPDPAAGVAMLGALLPFYAVALLAGLLFNALMFAAVNRAVLRPGVGGPGRLAAGGDEGRQLLLFVILGVLFFVAYVALLIVGVIVGVAMGLAVSGGQAPGPTASGPVAAVVLLATPAVFVALAVLATRLSLASPLTFDTGRLDVFGSWRMTRGVFWPLFGAYAMIALLAVLLYVVALILFGVAALAAGGGLSAAGVAFHPDTSSLQAYFAPAMLLWTVVASLTGTAVMTLFLAAPAGAYAQLKALGRMPGAQHGAPAPPPPASDLPRFGR